jgi:hypothetical protein
VDEQVSQKILPAIKQGIYEGRSFEVSVSSGVDKRTKQDRKKRK